MIFWIEKQNDSCDCEQYISKREKSYVLFTESPYFEGSKWGQNFSATGIDSPLWAKKRIKKHRNHVISVPFWLRRWDLNLTTSGL